MSDYYPSSTEVVEEARKIAVRIRYAFEKPGLTKEQQHAENQVLSSIAVVFWENGSKNFHQTVGAGLIETQDAMLYMDYPKKVLEDVNDALMNGTGKIWCHGVDQWRLSWQPKD